MAPPSAFLGTRDLLTGQPVVMTEQDFRTYHSFCKKYIDEFEPKTHAEEQMVRTIADTQWRLNRARAIECNLFSFHVSQANNVVPSNNTECQTALTQARMVSTLTKELSRLSIYEMRLTQVLESTLDRLQRSQQERRAKQLESLQIAAAIRTMRQQQRQSWTPSDDGFQFTLPEIDAHLRYENLVRQATTFTARC
jgi:hypothetical protein